MQFMFLKYLIVFSFAFLPKRCAFINYSKQNINIYNSRLVAISVNKLNQLTVRTECALLLLEIKYNSTP